ncbi:ABC transporter substrate-binding protein [Picosynechococcus sp. PCC 73109]|uniref:ABC transporter substrate-binding protein n=1 Tax=Picosynechococcus sp. PCC 73109 TaxID=374982 RepID=UPI0007458486|nr:iron-siderophore ABC transporter substrate-binding protein [Picosynechococcus sp. PCC 73109]AMA10799.1 iron siderophore-binding protein [Picosynechococcus sp. PCC 73109]
MQYQKNKPTIRPQILGLICLASMSLIGCFATTQNPSPTTTPEPVSQVPDEATRTIEHAMGTTEISGTPERIVVLTNEGTDMLVALGVTPVGTVKSWQGEPYYEYLSAELEDVPVIGDEFQPNLENIVALKPDLIIGSKVRQEQLYGKLQAIAPTVFSETLGATWKENFKLYAKALNREAEAQTLLEQWDQRVANLKEQLGDQPPTVSLVRFMPGTARIYYEQSFPGQIVAEVGLRRPEVQQKNDFAAEIGLESIQDLEADHLFYFTFNETENRGEDTQNQWQDHPLWQNLAVVENGNVYQVNDGEWTSSSGILAAHQVLNDLAKHILDETQN